MEKNTIFATSLLGTLAVSEDPRNFPLILTNLFYTVSSLQAEIRCNQIRYSQGLL